MNIQAVRLRTMVGLLLLVGLTACDLPGQAAAPTATSAPTLAVPTRTPRPTREPVAVPTSIPIAKPTEVQPTTTAPSGEILQVEFGQLARYDHPSGVFSIDIPENWSLQVNSTPDEIILVWTDPTENGAVIVDIFEDTTAYSDDQLTDILRTFLENSFGSEPEFSVDDPVTQSDGSILLVWTYLGTADNNVEVSLLGNSFIEQRENKVSILSTLIPSDQFDTLIDYTNEIINSYSIDPSAPLETGAGSSGSNQISSSAGLPATIVALGEAIDLGSGLSLTVTEVEEPKGDSLFTPESGNKFVIVRATFENSGSSSQTVSSLLQMSLRDRTGQSYSIDIKAAVLASETLDGEVPAGGSLSGGAGFQVPVDATGLLFVFEPLFGGESVGVSLD